METREEWNAGFDWQPGQPWRPQGAEQIASMPADVRRQYDHAARIYTFGADHKVDGKGRPIEQGIGAPGHETPSSRAALEKAEGEKALLRSKAGI